MELLNVFKKPEPQKEFCDMTQIERKNFLANDLIERMVRIEQRLRVSFGDKEVPYNQTQYFKELRPDEKERFTKYLKSKDKNKKLKWFSFALFSALSTSVFFRVSGNVIALNGFFSWTDLALVVAVVIIAVILFFHFKHGKKRKKIADKHFLVLEKIIMKRKHRHPN